MKKLICLTITFMLLFATVAPVMARTPEQILADTQYLNDQISVCESVYQQSNADVSSILLDLSQLNSLTITESAYSQGNPIPVKSNTFQTPQLFTREQAEQKLVQYVLGNIANIYRAEPLNTEIAGKIRADENAVQFYVYGPQTVQAINEMYLGIPNCFPIVYDRSSGHSHATTPITYPIAEEVVEKIDTPEAKELLSTIARKAIFTIDASSFVLENTTDNIVENTTTTITMDVSPYVKNDRTFVPVRYLAYAIGVKESDITWVQDTQQVIMTCNDKTVKMVIGSTTMLVNDTPVTMDVAPEITNNRTMLPARWLTEAMGANIEWNQDTTQATITVPTQ